MIDLKLFRKDNGIRQKEICTVLGVKQSYISLIECGARPLNREKYEMLKAHYGSVVDTYHDKFKQTNRLSSAEMKNETTLDNPVVDERSILLQLLAEKDKVINLLNEKCDSLAEKYQAALEKNARLEEKLQGFIAEKIVIKKIEPRDGAAELN